jgi:acyl-CoA thioester hydrolase
LPLELYAPGSEADWLRSFSWVRPLRPRFFETDGLGHVNNVFYTAYLEMARLDFFKALGDPEHTSTFFGFMHVAAEITLRFVKPCFFDEDLDIYTRIVKLGSSSAILEHAITSRGNADIRTLARVAIVSTADERPTPWSPTQRAILEPLVA